ncbi:dihydrodipicolinate synthase family protein [Kaustia mangrovi]|uniref:Dihydrodipicolinate synthase family protein n=1 Tax=Kaustia mangrovi TaxID=2593653 RepID=A0A7S8C2Y5_9HYPH|nr:dihydrodipicolinate synthase family protein [Kaustia mangrovi]QPC42413.1 dihydrodipicolinate synthase family protein [Kaustia mangrovi]
MTTQHSAGLAGVLSPVVTPFTEDLKPDADRWIRQCRWLLSQNCGLAVFGTNSEANSMAGSERMALLERLIEAGVDTGRMMPGTGACSLTETVEVTAHAVGLGCAGVLMLPPFYYKGVPDEGLYRHYSEVIQRVGDSRLKIYLYHIPPVAQVPISLDLIARLTADYPDTVVGIKDSSGDWSNTKAMLDRFPGFRVFAGSEAFLLDNMRNGGVGCISATANINPAAIHDLYANWQAGDADERQKALTDFRQAVAQYPMIPALKQTVAHFTGDAGWARVRPPLVELTADQKAGLVAELERRGFAMPGLREMA